jgi:hypothetical protein
VLLPLLTERDIHLLHSLSVLQQLGFLQHQTQAHAQMMQVLAVGKRKLEREPLEEEC